MTATSSRSWPPAVWQAINHLAELDRTHYTHHIFDPDAFLGTARARRAEQHRTLIDLLLTRTPNITAAAVVAACNPTAGRLAPPEATRRDYDTVRPDCGFCGRVGRVPVVQAGVERWTLCPECNPTQRREQVTGPNDG